MGNPRLSIAPGGGAKPDTPAPDTPVQAQPFQDLADALRSSESAGRAPIGAGAMLTNLAAALIARRRMAEMSGIGQPDPAAAASGPTVGAGPDDDFQTRFIAANLPSSADLTPQALGAALAANPPNTAGLPTPPAGLRQGAARGQPTSPG